MLVGSPRNLAGSENEEMYQGFQKDYADTIATFEKSVRNEPNNPAHRCALASILEAGREFDRAAVQYMAALNLDPGIREAQIRLSIYGQRLARSGSHEAAAKLFAGPAPRNPTHATSRPAGDNEAGPSSHPALPKRTPTRSHPLAREQKTPQASTSPRSCPTSRSRGCSN